MSGVLLFISRALLAFLDTISTLAGALGIRWLLGYSTPERDWRTFVTWCDAVVSFVLLPNPLADVNLAYLTRVRERYEAGWYTADTADMADMADTADTADTTDTVDTTDTAGTPNDKKT